MRKPVYVAALAAALLIGGMGAADAQSMPQPQTKGGITFISGGVDLGSQQFIKSLEKDYTLHLLFMQMGTGAFFANVPVLIVDNASVTTILTTVSTGPMFFAKLKPGSYSVTSSHNGEPITKSVVVPTGGSAELFFDWRPSQMTVYLEEATINDTHVAKLYDRPDKSGRVKALINLGEKVTPDGPTENGFAHVMYSNLDGWVMTKYLHQ
jgi:hypothetical protein